MSKICFKPSSAVWPGFRPNCSRSLLKSPFHAGFAISSFFRVAFRLSSISAVCFFSSSLCSSVKSEALSNFASSASTASSAIPAAASGVSDSPSTSGAFSGIFTSGSSPLASVTDTVAMIGAAPSWDSITFATPVAFAVTFTALPFSSFFTSTSAISGLSIATSKFSSSKEDSKNRLQLSFGSSPS